ncbi:MAG TPA: TadE family protein [Acidimicrobiales bacterium]|nr:TadE family protein [Acidimicrobiales bacterium]
MKRADQRTSSRRLRSRRNDERGASLVEFALILPIFMVMLMGMIDFGLVFGGYVSLRGGVQAGARLASVNNYNTGDCSSPSATTEMVCAIAARVGTNLPGATSSAIKVGIDIGGGQPGVDDVLVCEQTGITSTTGLTSWILSGKTITSESRLRLEQAPDFGDFTSGSTVSYGGKTITGMSCP